MREVVIVGGVRTPVGSFGGSLKTMSAVTLGSIAIKEALKRYGLRPVAPKEAKSIEPDSIKGLGITELEQKTYDYNDLLKITHSNALFNILIIQCSI